MEQVPNIYGSTAVAPPRSTTTEMVVSRQAQEVQAAMVIAKRFPRNEVESYNRIMKACQRKSLAERSMYEYPRGDTRVTGPSIRLAEAMAQNWGNIDFGVIELEQKSGESQVMAYAWDLETNTRQTKVFSVPHIRATKKGGNVPLKDPRDIYEMVANQGARRLRACILGVIPGDVIDAAISQCERTLAGDGREPLADTVRAVANTFETEYGVTVPMLEKFIGCKIESFTMQNLIRLKKVYVSLKDGMAKREDYFEMMPVTDDAEINNPFPEDKNGKQAGKKEKKAATTEPEPEPQEPDPSFIPPEGDPNLPF
ncbi:hypothetical protein [Hungatella hathewayi]